MQYLDFFKDNCLPLTLSLLAGFVIISLIHFLLRLELWKWYLRQEWVWLELVLPRQTSKTTSATEQFFSVLHGLRSSHTLADRILGRKASLSLEVTSTRAGGIKYVARIPKSLHAVFRQSIVSFLPEIQVNDISEALPVGGTIQKVVEFKQLGHFAYPLRRQDVLSENDPIAYLTGAMSKLDTAENVTFQIVISPAKASVTRGIENQLEELGRIQSIKNPVLRAILQMIFGVLDWILSLVESGLSGQNHSQQKSTKRPATTNQEPIRNANRSETIEQARQKLNQPLFEVNIRALVASKNSKTIHNRFSALKTSLASYNAPKQALVARHGLAGLRQLREYAFWHRLPSLYRGNACILSASEIASIYHFPFSMTAKPENLLKSFSRILHAPVSLKQPDTQLDIVIGENVHQGVTTPVGLTTQERERHMYVIGGTGNGKTTLIQYAIVQDMAKGKGVTVIDPHGDLAEAMLRYVPEERVQDVIYFNPDDIDYPVGLNMLEIDPALKGSELLKMKDSVTEAVISVFRKIFSDDDGGGHRIEYVLRNTIQTALTVENATLFTIFELLNDPDFNKKVVGKLESQELKNFWENEIGKAGDFQKVKMSAGITAKVGRFLFSASAKRVLEQPKSTINFDEVLDGKKILICNFSKGLIGEDTSALFGVMVLAQLQLAAMRRARQERTARTPYYLYVDEFQNFATLSFVQMLAEARKYQLFLTMAEQSTAQQEDQRMVDIILANVGTIVCFRSGSPADEQRLIPVFAPFLERGEIANLPSYNFYIRLAAIHSQEPTSGRTIVLQEASDQSVAESVKSSSRKLYAHKYVEPKPKKIVEKSKPVAKVARPMRRQRTNK